MASPKPLSNIRPTDSWKRRYDGSWDSLRDRSRRPHHHPSQHTPQEIKLIRDMRRRNPHSGLVVFWVKLMQRGYKRSIPGLYRFLKKQGFMSQKLPNPKYVPKPYEQMTYPGQRIQIDVKFVPACCLVNEARGKRFYQYTAIDEYSRWRYVEAFEEHSTYSSAKFLEHLLQRFPMPVECIQTDNGSEFTKRFSTPGRETLTLFQRVLKEQGIRHKLIRPFTPRHNGKVERSHRKDNERFYASHTFYSFHFSEEVNELSAGMKKTFFIYFFISWLFLYSSVLLFSIKGVKKRQQLLPLKRYKSFIKKIFNFF